MRHLVDQVLDIAKIAAGRLEVHAETIVLRPFVLNVVSELEPLITERGLKLSIAVGASLPRVRTMGTIVADRTRRQVRFGVVTERSRAARRLDGVGSTIFAEMSALAVRTGSVNLGQGFPDLSGPAAVVDAAYDAMRAGRNQYPPGRGTPELVDAVIRHQQRPPEPHLPRDRPKLPDDSRPEHQSRPKLEMECRTGPRPVHHLLASANNWFRLFRNSVPCAGTGVA